MKKTFFFIELAIFILSLASVLVGIVLSLYHWNIIYALISYMGICIACIIKIKNRQTAFIEAWIVQRENDALLDIEMLSRLEMYKKSDDYYNLIKTINGLN